MATNNELATRKALVQAFGGTTAGANEKDFDKALIAAVTNSTVKTKPAIVALTTESTANATDLATAQALANALKVKVNAIIAALKA